MRLTGSVRADGSPRRPQGRRTILAGSGALVLLGLTGCASEELPRLGLPTPATEEAPIVLSLWQGSWVAALAVGAVVWGLIIWAVIFHRKRSEKLPPQTRYNLPIEVLYTVIPFIIISVLFFFTARDQTKLLELSETPDHTVNVVGFQWSWAFNYVDEEVYEVGTPGRRPTLYLPQGESVRFELTSPDVIHSFWVPSFLFKLDVIPGRRNVFELTPTRLGTFSGKCAEFCGLDHARMLFEVRVVTREEFDQHMADLEARGQTGMLETDRITDTGQSEDEVSPSGVER